MDNSQSIPLETETPELPRWLRGTGFVLGISYPVLAISTFFRAAYQLFLKEGVTNYVGPSLTAVAAACYLTATVGFFVRQRWAWWLSVGVLSFETTMTFIVGTLSILYPETIGSTVWRYFGIDYGFFPLFQPLLGLAWLLHPATRVAYGISGERLRD
ncbi:MAG TPA: hypothetical protein PLK31_12035 [Chloroflexota bacterium]|nr:hypothetical protein [Chloroflexota bacterium]